MHILPLFCSLRSTFIPFQSCQIHKKARCVFPITSSVYNIWSLQDCSPVVLDRSCPRWKCCIHRGSSYYYLTQDFNSFKPFTPLGFITNKPCGHSPKWGKQQMMILCLQSALAVPILPRASPSSNLPQPHAPFFFLLESLIDPPECSYTPVLVYSIHILESRDPMSCVLFAVEFLCSPNSVLPTLKTKT